HALASALLAELAQSSGGIELGVAFLDGPVGNSIEESNHSIALDWPGFLEHFVTDGTDVLALDLCKNARAQCKRFHEAIWRSVRGRLAIRGLPAEVHLVPALLILPGIELPFRVLLQPCLE